MKVSPGADRSPASGELLEILQKHVARINHIHWLMIALFAGLAAYAYMVTRAAGIEQLRHSQVMSLVTMQQSLLQSINQSIQEIVQGDSGADRKSGEQAVPTPGFTRSRLAQETELLATTQDELTELLGLRKVRQANQAIYRVFHQIPYRLSDRLDEFIRDSEAILNNDNALDRTSLVNSKYFDPGAPQLRFLAAGMTAAIDHAIKQRILRSQKQYIEIRALWLVLIVSPALLTLVFYSPTILRLKQRQRWAAEKLEKARDESSLDIVTGLKNQHGFARDLSGLLHHAIHNDERMALIAMRVSNQYTDIDGLDIEQDEHIANVIADRLRELFSEAHTIGRLGTREFALVPKCSTNKIELGDQVFNIMDVIQRPIQLGDRLWAPKCHIGGIVFPDDGNRVDELLRGIDCAITRAGERNASGVTYFSPEMTQYATNQQQWVDEIALGLDSGQFCNFYLPVVDLNTRMCVGLEALVRWNHPRLGLLTPSTFLPQAIAAGLMDEITAAVFNHTARHCALWASKGVSPANISINLSDQVLVDRKLPAQVERLARRLRQFGTTLSLEVRESTFFDNNFDAIEAASAELRTAGAELVLDDFGMGSVSLANLLKLNCSDVKIDRTCVSRIETDDGSRDLVSMMVKVIDSLGLRSIAEGVATEWEQRYLLRLGCQFGQGSLFAMPMPADAVRNYLFEERDLSSEPDDYLDDGLAIKSV